MNMTKEHQAVVALLQAFKILLTVKPSRENALTLTKIEEALMWCNKDRTIKGEFKQNKTHANQAKA